MTRREFRANRLLLGLTQERLANEFGVNRNTITKWELGLLPLPKIAQWAIRGVLAGAGRKPSEQRVRRG